jgi:hypothetical protein
MPAEAITQAGLVQVMGELSELRAQIAAPSANLARADRNEREIGL